jgi:uncharacterized protein (DUF427 family)
VEEQNALIVVEFGGGYVARAEEALRVLETAHPPTYYLHRMYFTPGVLEPAEGRSVCEWKGVSRYWTVVGRDGSRAEAAAWDYPEPWEGYEALRDHIAIYPGRMSGVWLDEEQVQPQEGFFYGGWITSRVVGPFKGAPGTLTW